MEITEVLQQFYAETHRMAGLIQGLIAEIDKLRELAVANHTLLVGPNGHGALKQIEKLNKWIDRHQEWTERYLADRGMTCPVKEAITKLQDSIDEHADEVKTAQKDLAVRKWDRKTKILLAIIALVGPIFGGVGLAVFQMIFGGYP